MKVQLGARYRDVISGYQGIATGHVTYITGCNQVLLHPGLDDKGELRVPQWLDEQRLERVGDDVVAIDNGDTPGFDRAAPTLA